MSDSLFLSFQEALLGAYSLERELGRGGMGVVYLARDARLDRRVAIKVVPPELAEQPNVRERFLREARTAARLSHPNIVPIFLVDERGDFVYYVMAYVDGETLSQHVASSGPMRAPRVERMLREVGWALAYAHGQGVVHRDVKPANILIERETGRALVTDFGIARLSHTPGTTSAGELLGTPEYMSPEQASAEPVDGRSDLYSLGLVGYFALTGQAPFTGAAHAVLVAQLTQPVPAIASVARGTPRTLALALDRCLAKSPADRFANGEAFVEAISAATNARTNLSPTLRAFIDPTENALTLAPSLGIIVGLTIPIAAGDPALVLRTLPIVVGVVTPTAMYLARMRRLAREGFSAHDIAAAIRHRSEQRRDDLVFERGPTESTRDRMVRNVTRVLSVIGVIAFFGLSAWDLPMPREIYHAMLRVMHPAIMILAPLAGIGMMALPLAIATERMQLLRQGYVPRTARFWNGKVGQALMRIASWRLRRRQVASDRPTEVAIAVSVESLYAALPKGMRQGLGDVPSLARLLQERAEETRARIASLDDVAGKTEPASLRAAANQQSQSLAADIDAARRAADERLARLLTALETIRLDLLRLQAGVGSPDGVTQDLSAAEEILAQMDRLASAQRDVEIITSRAAARSRV